MDFCITIRRYQEMLDLESFRYIFLLYWQDMQISICEIYVQVVELSNIEIVLAIFSGAYALSTITQLPSI